MKDSHAVVGAMKKRYKEPWVGKMGRGQGTDVVIKVRGVPKEVITRQA